MTKLRTTLELEEQNEVSESTNPNSEIRKKILELIKSATDIDVMIKANENYWDSNATFNSAACGVIQAAKDQQLDTDAVKFAFSQVGVVCEAI
jgi:Zn-dependent metalloprotease